MCIVYLLVFPIIAFPLEISSYPAVHIYTVTESIIFPRIIHTRSPAFHWTSNADGGNAENCYGERKETRHKAYLHQLKGAFLKFDRKVVK